MFRAYELGRVSKEFRDIVARNMDILDAMISEERDGHFSYFALQTLRQTYLIRNGSELIERPQHIWLRSSLQMHQCDLEKVAASYEMMSTLKFMPGSPVLFNSGAVRPGISSCYLLPANEDPDEIFETLDKVARISRNGGGVGLGVQCVPSKGSKVKGIERTGVVPILKMLDAALDVIDQGSNKRPGAITVYMEPWHADILSFVRMKRNSGPEEERARKLFYGLMINDLFMRRVEEDEDWTLFCPSVAPQLVSSYGVTFEVEYEKLEKAERGTERIKARHLWTEIMESQMETGGPFILYKDSINRKSNQRHLGVITHSNLCTEIVQLSNQQETSVCNLASIVLPSFVSLERTFLFDELDRVVRHVVISLNQALVHSFFPLHSVRASAFNHRAIGIGIQGLADTFTLLGIAFDSPEAKQLNSDIAAAIYYSSVDESCELIKVHGAYPTFGNSPASKGWLQPNLWPGFAPSAKYDWDGLRKKAARGMCNSLLTAYMPTAGTSQLTGCSEGFEPLPCLISTRKVLNGLFTIIPKHFMATMEDLHLWSEDLRDQIVGANGSVQNIESIPSNVRAMFKTAWEIDPATVVEMAIDRAPYICQSQSLSLHLARPSIQTLTKLTFMGWKGGLKTGLYYLRSQPSIRPIPITLPVKYWKGVEKCANDLEEGSKEHPICLACE
ncbi:hypothetical protein D9611_001000 [Ephemerocybe angulata]|uniref:Ribonucleoside-diphosphate reductase n=1 Tax=Ephemerocybe angulata TaxID=980116 RepID=A0A8H5BNA7_9AGAR|nr:hypothetical protein D9611_001000 [Tulosesus angulatus]